MEGMGRLTGGYGMAVYTVWEGCLECLGSCLECVGRHHDECGEAVWKVWGRSLDGEGRLSVGCEEAVLKV